MAIQHVFVAGAGLMGHGIAQVHAAIGKDVALYEPELAKAQAGRDRIAVRRHRADDELRLLERAVQRRGGFDAGRKCNVRQIRGVG